MTALPNVLPSAAPHEHAHRAPITCPMCGGDNPPDAVFCKNAECRKALGAFRYVEEELREATRWHETLAEKATDFIGKPHFLVVHLLWFLLWIVVNSGAVALVRTFDMYPFGLLGIILGAEAVLIAGFILITQNRQNAYDNKRAELDYEVSVRTYREILAVQETLLEVVRRLESVEAAVQATRPSNRGQEEKDA